MLLPAGVLAGGLLGGAHGLTTPPEYTATSYVVAVAAEGADPASALGFAQAYGRIATQLAVLGDAQARARVPVATLERSVRTSTSPDAPMIAVAATSTRPARAVAMADAVSLALTEHAEAEAADTRVRLRPFARATKPAAPSSASPVLTALVGASAGGLLAGLALLVRPRRAPAPPGGHPAAGTATGPAVPGPAPAPAGRAAAPAPDAIARP
nr:lipopolysaccharide biosynthesis protein [Streptomyces sp. SHP 1-2]